jgi:3-methyladenine DNA glycosylase AlkD
MLELLKKELQELADEKQAALLQRFFKTGKGQYGEGDIFLGIKVPVQRGVAKKYENLSLPKIQELLKSKIHEHRLTGLIILTNKYKKAKEEDKANIFNFYLKNTKHINNWDLVDVTAPRIVGEFLYRNKKHRKILYELSRSENLWEKRIGIISTAYFITKEEFQDTLAISEILLNDSHDLIHKAVGWMLREVGKKDEAVLEDFLKQHYKDMPRTMLRYSIEKFEEDKRKAYLRGEIK